jgi:hypothetical protein
MLHERKSSYQQDIPFGSPGVMKDPHKLKMDMPGSAVRYLCDNPQSTRSVFVLNSVTEQIINAGHTHFPLPPKEKKLTRTWDVFRPA